MTILTYQVSLPAQEVVVKSVSQDWIYQLWVEYIQRKEDFYWEKGYKVMTKKYHLKRGHCCNSGCRHCPYKD